MPRPTVVALTAFLVMAGGLPRADAQTPTSDTATSWRRDGVCYEIFVRSFYDSDGDGIGDLKGLTQKLDYINDGNVRSTRSLGAKCVWLMPIAEAPSYHGYDVSNYYRVKPEYGTNEDFKHFAAEAHRRGIRVLVDMVLNHASSAHPYFQEALRDTASRYRGWFRWSATKPSQKGPWGQEVWHRSPLRDEYYYGVFWSGMPDLNYDNPEVREEAKRVARFWLQEMGVDGFRLDAVPYLVEEGQQLANTAGTHAVLREYGAYVRQIAPASFTVGEVWDSVGSMLPYYPDQLDSHFAFELANAIIDAVRTGSGKDLFTGYLRLQRTLPSDRWSPFLRNHDQTRTMTELRGDVGRAKLAATLLLTLPGLPFVYYGEEIGMTGDKPDERLRTPMHWTRAPAAGFTAGKPWETLQPDSLTANVQAEDGDPSSLLTLYRTLIHLRARNPALGSGRLVPLTTGSDAVTAYLRREGARTVLVVANLGAAPVTASVSWTEQILPAGDYAATSLVGRPRLLSLHVSGTGLSKHAALRLGPHESYVAELTLEH
jgi:glycosidase